MPLISFLALPSAPFIPFLVSYSSFVPRPCFACSQSEFFLLPRPVQVVAKVLESASVASARSLAGGLQTPWRRSTFQASHRPRSVQSVSCSDRLLVLVHDLVSLLKVVAYIERQGILLRRMSYGISGGD